MNKPVDIILKEKNDYDLFLTLRILNLYKRGEVEYFQINSSIDRLLINQQKEYPTFYQQIKEYIYQERKEFINEYSTTLLDRIDFTLF